MVETQKSQTKTHAVSLAQIKDKHNQNFVHYKKKRENKDIFFKAISLI
jgi:hypothetical protein